MKRKLKKTVAILCICLIFFAGSWIELKTNFMCEAIIIGQDIATGMLRIFERYAVLKESWFEKVLAYSSVLKENLYLANGSLITGFFYKRLQVF